MAVDEGHLLENTLKYYIADVIRSVDKYEDFTLTDDRTSPMVSPSTCITVLRTSRRIWQQRPPSFSPLHPSYLNSPLSPQKGEFRLGCSA
jgi:hypothetical protein